MQTEGVNLPEHRYKNGMDVKLRDVHLHPVQWHTDDRQFMGKADEFSMVSVPLDCQEAIHLLKFALLETLWIESQVLTLFWSHWERV